MSIKKRYLKSKPICKTTFTLPKEAVQSARRVCIAGDFNQWDPADTELKKNKDGSYSITIDLEKEHEYQYKYVIDESIWENDWEADKYVASEIPGNENSVAII